MLGFLVRGGNHLIARRPLPDRVTATFLVVLTSCSDRSLLVSQSICSMLAASCSLADGPGGAVVDELGALRLPKSKTHRSS